MFVRNHQLPVVASKIVIDALCIAASSAIAFLIRFDGHPSIHFVHLWQAQLGSLILIRLVTTCVATGYRLHWRFTSLTDAWVVLRTVLVGTAIFTVVVHLRSPEPWPRGVLLLEAFLTLNLMLAARVAVRIARNRFAQRRASKRDSRTVLVVGAGNTGEQIVRQMLSDPSANLEPVGFVDDDPARLHRRIHGVPVLGAIQDVAEIADAHRVDQILIAIPSLSGSAISGIVRQCARARADLTILPSLPQMVTSGASALAIRKVSVEDLLERSPVNVDLSAVAKYVRGERILVTGAGGSIGSELCRQIVDLQPECLIALGHDEACLYWIDQELQRQRGYRPTVVVADVKDRARMDDVFRLHRPTVVFHAAAHKHVPMMEANPGEAVKNNVFGTRNLAELSIQYGVRRFVMISTDKAVNPTSVMGATKRVAEMVVQSLAQRIETSGAGRPADDCWGFGPMAPGTAVTKFTSVRFGNVLGSSGSVVPTMQSQIASGGPVTVTHPEMERFFMTIPEAVQLVIQAGGMGGGGEIFVLDMGKPVKIIDLAWNLIRLSGMVPDVDIPIQITGIRPGEKLYEEVLTAEEGIRTTSHEKIRVARSTPLDHEGLRAGLMQLERGVQRGDGDIVREILSGIVPTYRRGPAPAQARQPARGKPAHNPATDALPVGGE
ncbi:MAG TPA: nucleoside-diphosphate sugar epimerase/dehydratase [Armatimonadota bacterium]|jgi:FlaA1/EpsC-like NDP-sugar epimerase